ncbi:MAG: 4Fe-4S binding protein [Firmicutes bacterium]|nr:4Fe-4S binding protein [Bacillota bacterium]
MKKFWYDYLWIASLLYLALGFFNILFAWLGMLCFLLPLILSAVKGTKIYCNRYCGRGQLFALLGGSLGLSRKKDIPGWMKKKWFRYGFLSFFLTMFALMLWNTYLVLAGAESLKTAVSLLWVFKLPWSWAYHGTLFHPAVAQFAFGFYSVMLTSTLLGLLTMIFFKPRSWCVYCPMGTMTQLICKGKSKNCDFVTDETHKNGYSDKKEEGGGYS